MNTRCEDGRLMRHDPMPDDPYLETDIGKCPECEGHGCIDPQDLADRLARESFEIYRQVKGGPRSAQIWLTEQERDLIVDCLR